jgi:hypothetical protein
MQIVIDNYTVDDPEVLFVEKDENDFSTNKKCTSFCSNWINDEECKNTKCTYAHSIEQLRRKTCLKDLKCKNKECTYKHTGQSDEDFMKRNKVKVFKQKDQVKSAIVYVGLTGPTSTDKYILETIKIARKTGRKALTFVLEDGDARKGTP